MEKNSSDSFSLEVRNRVAGLRVEQRADETPSRTIVGYAAVFDSWSDPINGWFKEKLDRHAFDDCDMSDVIMCFNHSINDLLARTTSGTLQLSIDDHGLRFSFEAPHTARGDEMLELVRRGDISQCSFRFSVAEDVWAYADNSNALEMSERTVLKIAKLYDTSLVVYPAYPDTEALMRLKLSIQQDVRDLIASDISSIINARYCQFLELKE